jgi:hypothetical protein
MFDPVWPQRFERGYATMLWDEVVLIPHQDHAKRATIRLRRRISIPWWPEWLPAAYQGAAITSRKLSSTPPKRQ